ncbi:type II toxin-antitoxin system Phd/YefM family antitoxin [Limnobaculum xujianqingii]|uniref:type II toxin-antitoxin system Phd/YefM family antitoxin n=1 Tax=Limnobaculum xujianqingii TaxID=2738837 RepID=UPI00112E011E|nr:hypothetical protein [Limnobaculum xujianqingii]
MKTFTYTQMRSELSDILELMRAGDSVRITQKNKPDILLGNIVTNTAIETLKRQLEESPTEIIKRALEESPDEFTKALLHTQTKHAAIIKKLEDK